MSLKPDFDFVQIQFPQARAGFLMAEVELGLTFSQLAIDTKDREKRLRCTRLAREAYNTIDKFVQEISLPELGELRTLRPGLIRLRTNLEILGVTSRIEPLLIALD